ncbi:prepilin-type N-terminal cleavage/methylation domain-containing protein [bacterium]|nr:prepilin-type N-terminal cleavage/methylation domain-containing protein [bacterium]MCP5461583.1 prepilin-type N-terminal cleavage/methylation domain-containing protein [bacterium]
MRAGSKGFTLIELMAVAIILLILVGLGVPAIRYHYGKSKKNKAIAQLLRLETALENYKNDLGAYPVVLTEAEYFGDSGSDKNKRSVLIQALSGFDKNKNKLAQYWNDSDWHGPYLEFTAKELDASGQFIDPWKQPYLFDGTAGGRALKNLQSFDIVSRGEDKQWDSSNAGNPLNDDNIVNWTGDFTAQ